MNPTYYLAVDIGASSGRHILGHMEGDRLILEEIYRFPNGMQKKEWTARLGELRPAGSVLGTLLPEVSAEVGYDLTVMLPATHDTGSAVLAVPTNSDDAIYISSGTWSLMGIERLTPDASEASRKHNFTNEGGYAKRYRYLKNIMGLWIIQSIKKELRDYSFSELSEMAKTGTPTVIDVDDPRLLAPESMIEAVKATAGKIDMPIEDVLASVYHGLADCYMRTAHEIEALTGKTYPVIHIIGGGCRDDYLSHLTAEKSGKRVFAGPVEATAIGNILAQMLGQKVFSSIGEARECVARSFDVSEKK